MLMVGQELIVLVGPEDGRRVQNAQSGCAPRLDYRLVAERCEGVVKQCYPSPASLHGPRILRVFRSMLTNTRIAAQVIKSVPSESVIYSTGETWGLPVAIAGGMMRRRRHTHVVVAHRVFSPLRLWLIRGLQSSLHVDGWICITHYQARLLRQALGSRGAPVAVVSQGVDTAFFDPVKASPSQPAPYILSIGAEMRDYPLLFEAVRNLDVEVIVKASSAWTTGVQRQFKSVPPNVTWLTGYVSYPELRDLYAGASLVVVPLHDTYQAAGITTILEAMAMQKCIVATRSRGLPDSLIDGVTGLVVEPSAERIAEAILGVLRSPDRAAELAANGQRWARGGGSLEAHAAAVTGFLTHVARLGKTLCKIL